MTYTNSPLVNFTKISPNKTPNRNHVIDTITIHCVVGQCSVERLGEIFAPTSKQASSNYGIGYDGKVGMYVEEKDRSWCSSSSANDNRAITIEVASDTAEPYAVNDKAYATLLNLVTDICKRNGIKKLVWSENKNDRVNHLNGCNMTVHRDYANKSCPGKYLYDRHGAIAAEVNKRLGAGTTTVVPTEKGNASETVYTVKKGDTLSGIAAKYGTTYQKIAEYNGIANPNIISVGQKIRIPGSNSAKASSGASAPAKIAAQTTTADPKAIWDFLIGKIGNPFGAAGLMGNLYAESALVPNNLQNSYEKSLGYTDKAYTDAVDAGTYTKFSGDAAGYGLAQWTYHTRKAALLAYAKEQKASIGNLTMQLNFLMKELSESYPGVLSTLKNAKTVLEASNAVLLKFERPADQSTTAQNRRASYGQKYYDTYAKGTTNTTPAEKPATGKKTYKLAPAHSFDKALAGQYKTVGDYNMRYVPGELVAENVIAVIPKGKTVQCYGYYTAVSGKKWLYVVYNGKTGFVTMEGLKK